MFKRGEQHILNAKGAEYFNHWLNKNGVFDQRAENGDKVWVLEDCTHPFCALVKYHREIPELDRYQQVALSGDEFTDN